MHRPAIPFLALVMVAGACSPGPDPIDPVVLVTLDTFRADHLGCAGNPVVRTPHLDRLARSGGHWAEAVSPIPLTTPSHATILSGRTPRGHGLLRNRMRLPESVETLPQILSRSRVVTAAVVSSSLVLGPEMGLDRGFDEYSVLEVASFPASGQGRETTEIALDFLDRTGATAGFFLWVHYFDAHLPYLAPPPLDRLYDRGYDGPVTREVAARPIQDLFPGEGALAPRDVEHVAALYAAEVTFLDGAVGALIRGVRERVGGATRFVVTADHGETLHEHEAYFGHDKHLYDTSLRVPLVIAGPGTQAGRLSREAARTTDVAPTILGLCGWLPGSTMVGRDLLRDPAPSGDDAFFVAETHPGKEKSHPLYAMRTPERKVIWRPRERRHEFYDLRRDPAERADLAGDPGRLLEVMAEDLELDLRNRPVGSTVTIDDERGGADEKTREQLRALGYAD